VLKEAILIKPSHKTDAEIALDRMPLSASIERGVLQRNEPRLEEVLERDPRSIILQKRRRGGGCACDVLTYSYNKYDLPFAIVMGKG
jgi:hypothetical protein